jgi:hypothetical protein
LNGRFKINYFSLPGENAPGKLHYEVDVTFLIDPQTIIQPMKKKINWLQVAGIVAVTCLVFILLFTFTAFLRRLPQFQLSVFSNLLITLVATVSSVYYISKTGYGVKDKDIDK